jgi:hypothetical protein
LAFAVIFLDVAEICVPEHKENIQPKATQKLAD